MEFLILFTSIAVVTLLAVIVLIFLGVVSYINKLFVQFENKLDELSKNNSGYTTDPFEKQKETMQSSSHIIVPNTPDQIRNKNFQKIKEGQNYGNID